MIVTGASNLFASFNDLVTAGRVSPESIPTVLSQHIDWSNGTGPGQIDLLHSKPYALVAATPQTLDLTSGLLGPAGAAEALVYARVRQVWASVPDAVLTHILLLGPGASNGWTPLGGVIAVFPGLSASGGVNWVLLYNDPYSTGAGVGGVVGASSKTLKLDPGAFSFTANLVITGTTVA
jgi:hypothetical protein